MLGKQEQTNYRRQGTCGKLSLHGTLDISVAAELHATTKKALADAKVRELIIDFWGIERLDVSALQILCAFARDIRAAGRVCSMDCLNGVARETIERLGVVL